MMKNIIITKEVKPIKNTPFDFSNKATINVMHTGNTRIQSGDI